MLAALHNPLIRNPAIRNPANHYRLACIRPARAARSMAPPRHRPAIGDLPLVADSGPWRRPIGRWRLARLLPQRV
eukprot:4656308-Alexandrium_andersonii.AAC.1